MEVSTVALDRQGGPSLRRDYLQPFIGWKHHRGILMLWPHSGLGTDVFAVCGSSGS
jgi:hypothetical protein